MVLSRFPACQPLACKLLEDVNTRVDYRPVWRPRSQETGHRCGLFPKLGGYLVFERVLLFGV